MAEYEKVLQEFINQNVMYIVLLVVVALVCVLLIWLLPTVQRLMSDSHKPGRSRHSHRSRKARFTAYIMKHDTIFVQVVLTAVCLVLLVPAIQCVSTIQSLQSDIEDSSYLVYEGKYNVSAAPVSLENLFRDVRFIEVNGRTNALTCDMGRVDCDLADGDHKGTVVYGQKSGVVVKLTIDNDQ